jgi:hypothetical protein
LVRAVCARLSGLAVWRGGCWAACRGCSSACQASGPKRHRVRRALANHLQVLVGHYRIGDVHREGMARRRSVPAASAPAPETCVRPAVCWPLSAPVDVRGSSPQRRDGTRCAIGPDGACGVDVLAREAPIPHRRSATHSVESGLTPDGVQICRSRAASFCADDLPGEGCAGRAIGRASDRKQVLPVVLDVDHQAGGWWHSAPAGLHARYGTSSVLSRPHRSPTLARRG